MKTKIVYCIVSDPTDYYYEQLLISLYSLRKHNPKAYVEVLCDEVTYSTLTGERTKLFEYCDIVTPIQTPNGWRKVERSRYLKTNLRSLTQGDYLFIDTDTVICKPLDEVDELTCDLGAVYDVHLERTVEESLRTHSERWLNTHAIMANVDVFGMQHFNSGVLYVKDNASTHQFYERWNDLYQGFLKSGVKIDQLSFAVANHESGNIIEPLCGTFNCQAHTQLAKRYINEAFIIHYICNSDNFIITSPWLLDVIKETGTIPITVRRIVDSPMKFFNHRSKILEGEELDYLNSFLYKISKTSPRLHAAIVKQVKLYIRLKTFFRG